MGGFNEVTCPDPHGLPSYWYKKYEVPRDKGRIVFDRLLEIRDQLVRDEVIPTQEDYARVFPDISTILEASHEN